MKIVKNENELQAWLRLKEIAEENIQDLTGEKPEYSEKKKFELLNAIHEQGGAVNQKAFDKIIKKVGYSKQGVNGLFSWKSRNPKISKAEKLAGTEYFITPAGVKWLELFGK